MTLKTRINAIRATIAASFGALQTTVSDTLSGGVHSAVEGIDYGIDCIAELSQRAKFIVASTIGLACGLIGIVVFYAALVPVALFKVGQDFVQSADGNPFRAFRNLLGDYHDDVKRAATIDRSYL